jgi:mannosyl-3-phosphoglycerate phosphatase
MMQVIIFSDLDGTFLDHQTYSFAAALPALEQIKSRRIPLIFCSSKTRAEIEEVQRAVGIHEPFIVENGGAICIPQNYFAFEIPGVHQRDSYWVYDFGTAYAELTAKLQRIARKASVPVLGFHNMTIEQVAAECGLTLAQAHRAKMREYDEPFKILTNDLEAIVRLEKVIANNGLRCTRGGRFFHLTGKNDKGMAVTKLIHLFQRSFNDLLTVGIGDSQNDLDLLRVVDCPVLFQKPGGYYDDDVQKQIRNVQLAGQIGPAGWNEAVTEILNKID